MNFAEALIPLYNPRREKLSQRIHEGAYGLHMGTGQRLDTTSAAWTTSANYYVSHKA